MISVSEQGEKKIIDVDIGDKLADGSIVTGIMELSSRGQEVYKMDGVTVTANHSIYHDEMGWIRVDEHPQAYKGGAHGYDPAEPAMGGIFVASVPDFKPGTSIDVVESVHLYELLCYLLRIVPSENDGKLETWNGILN